VTSEKPALRADLPPVDLLAGAATSDRRRAPSSTRGQRARDRRWDAARSVGPRPRVAGPPRLVRGALLESVARRDLEPAGRTRRDSGEPRRPVRESPQATHLIEDHRLPTVAA